MIKAKKSKKFLFCFTGSPVKDPEVASHNAVGRTTRMPTGQHAPRQAAPTAEQEVESLKAHVALLQKEPSDLDGSNKSVPLDSKVHSGQSAPATLAQHDAPSVNLPAAGSEPQQLGTIAHAALATCSAAAPGHGTEQQSQTPRHALPSDQPGQQDQTAILTNSTTASSPGDSSKPSLSQAGEPQDAAGTGLAADLVLLEIESSLQPPAPQLSRANGTALAQLHAPAPHLMELQHRQETSAATNRLAHAPGSEHAPAAGIVQLSGLEPRAVAPDTTSAGPDVQPELNSMLLHVESLQHHNSQMSQLLERLQVENEQLKSEAAATKSGQQPGEEEMSTQRAEQDEHVREGEGTVPPYIQTPERIGLPLARRQAVADSRSRQSLGPLETSVPLVIIGPPNSPASPVNPGTTPTAPVTATPTTATPAAAAAAAGCMTAEGGTAPGPAGVPGQLPGAGSTSLVATAPSGSVYSEARSAAAAQQPSEALQAPSTPPSCSALALPRIVSSPSTSGASVAVDYEGEATPEVAAAEVAAAQLAAGELPALQVAATQVAAAEVAAAEAAAAEAAAAEAATAVAVEAAAAEAAAAEAAAAAAEAAAARAAILAPDTPNDADAGTGAVDTGAVNAGATAEAATNAGSAIKAATHACSATAEAFTDAGGADGAPTHRAGTLRVCSSDAIPSDTAVVIDPNVPAAKQRSVPPQQAARATVHLKPVLPTTVSRRQVRNWSKYLVHQLLAAIESAYGLAGAMVGIARGCAWLAAGGMFRAKPGQA